MHRGHVNVSADVVDQCEHRIPDDVIAFEFHEQRHVECGSKAKISGIS